MSTDLTEAASEVSRLEAEVGDKTAVSSGVTRRIVKLRRSLEAEPASEERNQLLDRLDAIVFGE